MYEAVWLGIIIMYEIILGLLPILSIFVFIIIILYWLALRHTHLLSLKRSFKLLCYIGILIFLALLLLVPIISGSSIYEVSYWLDALFLAIISLGFTALIMLVLWPLLALKYK